MLYFNTMALCWISVHAVLWSIIGSFTANVRASPCAEVQAPSTVVRIGSPVTASCYIKDNCSLTEGQDFQVEWPYEANLNYSNQYSQDKRLHKILISNFTNTTAMLECAICKHGHCDVVGGVQVIAAHPPLAPQNLTCQLNLTELSMWCTWNPGQQTSSIPTNYTLHTEIRESSQRFEYVPAPGKPYYRVPREGFSFFDKLQVHVKAVNTLGHATSEQWVREPMETAKLDAPELQNSGEQKYGCLSYLWHLSKPQNWIVKEFNTEIRLKPLNDFLGKEQVFTEKRKPVKRVMVCNLLHGIMYQSEMRVRYLNSPWSEWSRPINATTLMKAPTGQLVTWLKILEHSKNRPNRAELFWKPSSQFRANSMNVSYIVTLVGLHIKSRTVCETYQPSCSFHILQDTRKIHLTAVNKAGKSNVTVVAMYRHTGRDSVPYLKVLSNSEESVLTTWSSPKSSDVTSYVLEWKALPVTIPTTVSFEIVDNNTFSLEITGLKPYKPYEISIYPKYKDGIGLPWNVMAYTREKAPSASPNLELREIRPSYVKLLWEKIPIEERNGIITSYKIFYWDVKDKDNIRDVEETENHALLKNLHPSSIYNIFLMTSTAGGSVNGSIVIVETPSIDAFEIVLIVIPACVGLALFFLGMFTCFGSNKCLKKCLWPMIPDPANSSIKKWTVADSPQDMPPLKEVKDPALVYLSHFSLLSLSEKELWKGKTTDYLHCKKWSFDDDDDESTNEDHSDSSRDSGIYNSGSQSESVPYATVVFANPYRTQPAPLPASQCSESTHLPTYQRSGSTHLPAYQRSESTQPLLGEEEPSSPRLFEKMPTQEELTEADHFTTFQEHSKSNEGSLWKDFPMLQALEIKSINK